MNKKVNTMLFIIGATVVNIIIMGVLFLLGFVIVSRLMPKEASPNVLLIAFMVVFIGSIFGSFFIYHKLVGFISKKIDMDKYFHPIFKFRGKKKP